MAFKLLVILSLISSNYCYLRPQETASRQVKSLDGLWKFKLSPEQGLRPTRDEKELVATKDVSISSKFIIFTN